MTPNDIEQAFGQRLENANIASIAWPNRDFEPDGEYLEFRHAPTSTQDPVISGGFEYDLGLVLITAVVPAGEFTARANEMAQQVRVLLPKALRMAEPSGTVVINSPPSLGSGFQDGSYWRQPVVVSYITE